MIPVLLLFLVPFGAAVPAGVLLSKSHGIGWPLMTFLYFISDVVLALYFEPMLRLVIAVGRRFPLLARVTESLRRTSARTAAYFGGATAGPITLILIAFGVDPMTGRTAAAAAGHGFVSGWALAITGDMFSFLVVAAATLKVSHVLGGNSNKMIAEVTVAMLIGVFVCHRLMSILLRRFAGR
jgi:hypothetical protein